MNQIGAYQILGLLGEGGMATVYKGQRYPDSPIVAVKLLKPEALNLLELKARFLREIRITSKLSHPNIVHFIDKGTHEQKPFLVTDMMENGDLRQFLKIHAPSLKTTLFIIRDVCEGLQYAHQLGVIHRDLKPGNILISKQNTAKISDFGIATALWSEQTQLTQTRDTLGTIDYIAPEQRISPKHVDFRCDHYAIGVILYELVTKKKPLGLFPAPISLNPNIPPHLNELITTCLQPDPSDRLVDTSILLEELNHILFSFEEFDIKSPAVSNPDAPETAYTQLSIPKIFARFEGLPLHKKLEQKPHIIRQLQLAPTALILDALNCTSGIFKEILIEAMAFHQDPLICKALIELLNQPDYNEKASLALAELACPEAERGLLTMLMSERNDAYLAIKPLGQIKSQDAVRPLSKFITNPYDWIRHLALDALAKIGNSKCQQLIQSCSQKHQNTQTRAYAQILLRRFFK